MPAGRCSRVLRDWILIQKREDTTRVEAWTVEMEKMSARSPEATLGITTDAAIFNFMIL
jgi:hypothetical protein